MSVAVNSATDILIPPQNSRNQNGKGQGSGVCALFSGSIALSVSRSFLRKGGKNAPQYSLFGVGSGGNAFWGESNVFLGWYANEELLSREIAEIQQAIRQGNGTYELKYSAKVEKKWLRILLAES